MSKKANLWSFISETVTCILTLVSLSIPYDRLCSTFPIDCVVKPFYLNLFLSITKLNLCSYPCSPPALDCSGDTSGVVVPASCTTCYDVIGKRCLRNMEILQDACREGICVLMQGKYVLRTRRT